MKRHGLFWHYNHHLFTIHHGTNGNGTGIVFSYRMHTYTLYFFY
jgi:hypothetical protein